MAHDDELPPPNAPATAAEAVRAQGFAALVDGLLAERPTPPLLDASDRALIETAAIVRAAAGREFTLSPDVRQRAIDAALGQAVGTAAAIGALPPRPVPASAEPSPRRARATAVPWLLAAFAAAAAVALAVRLPSEPATAADGLARALPAAQRSRPADALIGAIPREQAADASVRLDALFADRLAGFRALRLSPARRSQPRRGPP